MAGNARTLATDLEPAHANEREGGHIPLESPIALAPTEARWLRKVEAFVLRHSGAARALVAAGRNSSDRSLAERRPGRGEVALVGCGPGDPDLLTLRALKALRAAETIVYDHLVSNEILELARPGVRRIYVGKERGRHTLAQDRINALLIALAREGLQVARLKGGDPFIFGRGGEELEALVASGVAVRVIPGITAACGAAASAGVALTHRDHAHACIFVTGHLQNGTMNLDWDGLARPSQTVVVYMGLAGLPILARELIRHGLPGTTPAMIVAQATLPNERVVTAMLETLPQRALAANLGPPTLIVIGDVVGMRTMLNEHAALSSGRAASGKASSAGA